MPKTLPTFSYSPALAGAGKSYAILDRIKSSTDRYIYLIPSLAGAEEIYYKLPKSRRFLISSMDSTDSVVKQWNSLSPEFKDDSVVVMTHAGAEWVLPHVKDLHTWNIIHDEDTSCYEIFEGNIPTLCTDMLPILEAKPVTACEELSEVVVRDSIKAIEYLNTCINNNATAIQYKLIDNLLLGNKIYTHTDIWQDLVVAGNYHRTLKKGDTTYVDELGGREVNTRNSLAFLLFKRPAQFLKAKSFTILSAYFEQSITFLAYKYLFKVKWQKDMHIESRVKFTEHDGSNLEFIWRHDDKPSVTKARKYTRRDWIDFSNLLGSRDFIYSINSKVEDIELGTKVASNCHGLNKYQQFNDAYIGRVCSLSPREASLFKVLGMDYKELVHKITVESVYQSLSRVGSIRDNQGGTRKGIFLVPFKSICEAVASRFIGAKMSKMTKDGFLVDTKLVRKKALAKTAAIFNTKEAHAEYLIKCSEHKQEVYKIYRSEYGKARYSQYVNKPGEKERRLKAAYKSLNKKMTERLTFNDWVELQATSGAENDTLVLHNINQFRGVDARSPFKVNTLIDTHDFFNALEDLPKVNRINNKINNICILPNLLVPNDEGKFYRNKSAVAGTTMIVLDIDDGDVTFDEVVDAFKVKLGVTSYIHTSFSASKESPNRMRVYVPLNRFVVPDEHSALCAILIAKLQHYFPAKALGIDMGKINLSSMFYAPCVNTEQIEGYRSQKIKAQNRWVIQKSLLNVDAYLLASGYLAHKDNSTELINNSTPVSTTAAPTQTSQYSHIKKEAVLAELSKGHIYLGNHLDFGRAVCALKHGGCTVDEIEPILSKISRSKTRKDLEYAYKSFTKVPYSWICQVVSLTCLNAI